MYKCLEPFRAVGCNQITFPETRSAAWIKLWINITDNWFAAHTSSRSSWGGYTWHVRAAEIKPITLGVVGGMNAQAFNDSLPQVWWHLNLDELPWANAWNIRFQISLWWPIHIINPVDKTKLPSKLWKVNLYLLQSASHVLPLAIRWQYDDHLHLQHTCALYTISTPQFKNWTE